MIIHTLIECTDFSLIFNQNIEKEVDFSLTFQNENDKIHFSKKPHILAILKKFLFCMDRQNPYVNYIDQVEFTSNSHGFLTIEYNFKYINMSLSDCRILIPVITSIIEVITNAKNN